MSKQVIPRRVGNLTAPLCDIAEDLINYLKETNNGDIKDLTPIIIKWTFQSNILSINPCLYAFTLLYESTLWQVLLTLCLERT